MAGAEPMAVVPFCALPALLRNLAPAGTLTPETHNARYRTTGLPRSRAYRRSSSRFAVPEQTRRILDRASFLVSVAKSRHFFAGRDDLVRRVSGELRHRSPAVRTPGKRRQVAALPKVTCFGTNETAFPIQRGNILVNPPYGTFCRAERYPEQRGILPTEGPFEEPGRTRTDTRAFPACRQSIPALRSRC